MNQAKSSLLATTGTAINTGYSGNINGYSGTSVTTVTDGSGLVLQGNSTINYPNNLGLSTAITNSNNMSKQVKVAVFTVKRNDKNEIISSEFIKEFWVEQKNGGSIVLAASKQLDKDFDPETTVIREIYTVSF
jgi:hypothetical protein